MIIIPNILDSKSPIAHNHQPSFISYIMLYPLCISLLTLPPHYLLNYYCTYHQTTQLLNTAPWIQKRGIQLPTGALHALAQLAQWLCSGLDFENNTVWSAQKYKYHEASNCPIFSGGKKAKAFVSFLFKELLMRRVCAAVARERHWKTTSDQWTASRERIGARRSGKPWPVQCMRSFHCFRALAVRA